MGGDCFGVGFCLFNFLTSGSGSILGVNRIDPLDMRKSLRISGDYQERKERFAPKW